METRVYKVSGAIANNILDDPNIKRFGEARKFEFSALELKGDGVIVVVRGDTKVFEMEIFKDLEEMENKDVVIKKVEELDDAAASGVGTLFG